MSDGAKSLEKLTLEEKRALAKQMLARKMAQPRTHEVSFAQQRLWFLHQLEPDSPFYNMPAAIRLRGQLDVSALQRALDGLVRRHESLRTTFAEQNGRPVQQIHPHLPVALALQDLQGVPAERREAQMRELARQEARAPFALARGPLLRSTLLRLAPDDHVLLLTMHHIVSDGWSIGILLRELTALYTELSSGRPSPLPPLPIQYADFAHWQRQWLAGNILESQLSYWKQQLSGELPILKLPGDRPRPAVQSFRGSTYRLTYPPSLVRAVRQLAHEEGATPFMVLLAGFKALLARYSGLSDIVVGSPIANRNRLETESLIGFFVNTLVLRTDLSGQLSFREAIRRVRDVTLGAYAHQDLPFDKLVETLQPERSLSYTPLFQTMFVLLNAPSAPAILPGVSVEIMELDSATSQFDLSLTLQETEGSLVAALEYSADLFDEPTVARMAVHFGQLLRGAVEQPDSLLVDLPLLDPAESRAELAAGRGPRRELPDVCVHALIEAEAARTPEAIAVEDEHGELSYGELNRRAEQLARRLRGAGVGPEILVAVHLERSVDLPIALLGILKAGGAYVCLDPDYPSARLGLMLEDSRASILITRRAHLPTLPPFTGQILCLDALPEGPLADSGPTPHPNNLAYVVYTSGSTGQPKGAMVSHRSLVSSYRGWEESYALRGPSRAHLQMASCSFDVFSGDFVRALCSGGKLIFCPRELLMQPPQLLDFMRRHGADSAEFVPAVLRGLTQHLEETKQSLDFMQLVVAGSDTWYASEFQAVRRLCGSRTRLINSYGLSEATIDSSFFEDIEGHLTSEGLVPIGRAFANARLYILDTTMRPVPRGVVGELYVGGVNLARGYFRRPELTAERFIPDPFSEEPGQRLYRTGDLARLLPDGNVEFLGRQDDQVKIRGFRVELGEIEAIVRTHPAIRGAVVIAHEDRSGHKRLIAYVAPAKDAPASVQNEVRAFLKAKLPAYMVPSAVVTLDELPVSPNGKVNRRALPAPTETGGGAEESSLSPRTPTEAVLATIWKEILGVESVGVEDNFFELGGDSILTIQLIARARKAGLTLTPRMLFQHQTVAELAVACEAGGGTSAEQAPVTGPVRPSPILRWFFEQHFPEPHHWNQGIMLEVTELVHAELLKHAAQHLVTHHDALRLRCERGTTGWELTCRGPSLEVELVQRDLSQVPSGDRPRALADAATELHASMRLTEGALLKLGLFNLGPSTPPRLLLTAHHIAVDGVSWRILLEDLETVYRQLSAGSTVSLPPKTTSFQAWSERLARSAASETLEAEWPYWLSVAEAAAPRLPVDLPAPVEANTEESARTLHISLGAEKTQALLRGLPRRHGAQLQDALLAACLKVFTRWTGAPTLRIDLESHGREPLFDDVDLSRTVGWFTSVFPVVLRSGDTASMTALLTTVRDQLRDVPRRGIGYGLLRHFSEDPRARRLREAPAPEVSFNYLGQADAARGASTAFRLANESPGMARAPSARRGYLLDIEGHVLEGQLQVSFTYSERLHHPETVERLAKDFLGVLEALALVGSADPRVPTPADFPLVKLEQTAFDRILAGGSDLEDVYPLSAMQRGMLFHTLHERGVAMYIDQLSCLLEGPLDIPAFQRAWRMVLARHPGLRVAILWEGLPEPVQLVRGGVEAPWVLQDWSELPASEQQQRLATLVAQARAEPLPLSSPPLMRFALIQLGPERYRFLWTHHHILFDGWSLAILMRELLACYEATRLGREPDLPPSRPYRDFIGWLQRQDTAEAESFWRGQLAGFRRPTAPVTLVQRPARAGHGREQTRHVPAETTAALQVLSRQLQIPLNSVLQAAWALLLSRYTGQEDVAFGITISGRPPTLEGVEGMIGLFINTVPLRVRVPDGSTPLRDWFKSLQRLQTEITGFGYTPLTQLHGWSELPREVPLFETLFVFQNHPLHQTLGMTAGGLRLTEADLQARASYPLALAVIPGPQLLLHALYDEERYSDGAIVQILDHLTHVLTRFVTDVEQPPSAVTLGTTPQATPATADMDAGDFDFDATGSSGTES